MIYIEQREYNAIRMQQRAGLLFRGREAAVQTKRARVLSQTHSAQNIRFILSLESNECSISFILYHLCLTRKLL